MQHSKQRMRKTTPQCLEGHYGVIASLSELTQKHAIVSTGSVYNNRVTMTLDGIGDWFFYANTGCCFKSCDQETSEMIHETLERDGTYHTVKFYLGNVSVKL